MASRLERSGNNVSNAIARDHIAKHHPTELTYDDDVEAFKHVKATAVPPVIVHAGSARWRHNAGRWAAVHVGADVMITKPGLGQH